MCQFQVYSKVNQLYMYPLFCRFPSHLGHHRKCLLFFFFLCVCMVFESVLISFFSCSCSVLPAPFTEETVFSPLYVLASFVIDQWIIIAWIYLWAFCPGSLIYIYVFVPLPNWFDYCSFETPNNQSHLEKEQSWRNQATCHQTILQKYFQNDCTFNLVTKY